MSFLWFPVESLFSLSFFATNYKNSVFLYFQKYPGDELDVGAIMNTWTGQAGFPLVTVDVSSRQVKLSQERYVKGGDDAEG